ncbi:MAG: hydrogenase maturation nickel metallochaperone HypA [Actinomycetia bacterium]|nr:hydrogenase maturation nickel metallochaperone HypA [Actinomycetes bacterium]
MTSVLETALAAATAATAARITRITLSIGELSDVLPEAMHFAHQALVPNTLADGSELQIKLVAARAHCLSCDAEYHPQAYQIVCPYCQSFAVELLSGRELTIDAVEVEHAD